MTPRAATTPAAPVARANEIARRLDEWATARGWAGSDPYEGLNATRFAQAARGSAIGKRIFMQVVKRSPIDLRPLLGIAPRPNAASVAWLVSAYARGCFLPRPQAEDKLDQTLRLLATLRAPGYPQLCWGYPFDVQTRVLFMARDSPNTIATAYAGQAILDAHERTGDERLLRIAESTGHFFVRQVPQTRTSVGDYFGYAPGDRSPIHNANMHVAGFLARLARVVADGEQFAEPARRALAYTLAHQRSDGSWPYGEQPNLHWIDGFHTGYVLDALRRCADAGLEDAAAHDAWMRGLDFYRHNLFLDDGTPRYSVSSTYPIDAQSAAQGIQTLSIGAAHDRSLAATAWKVFDFATAKLRRRDGLFVFQRRRLWTNSTPHLRWVVAPMLLALTYLTAIDESNGAGDSQRAGPLLPQA